MNVRDRLVPGSALLAVVAVAFVVVSLLRGASDDGIEALKDAKHAQVRSTASSFDARLESTFAAVAGLGARPWELVRGSEADAAALETFAIDPDAVSGYFLVDGEDTITNGVLLRPGRLGSTYDAAAWADVKASLATAPAVVLPVESSGVTTELPTYAFAVAIRGASPTSVRGAFVFEQALTPDSAFSLEIRALADSPGSQAARHVAVPGQQRHRRRDDPPGRSGRAGAGARAAYGARGSRRRRRRPRRQRRRPRRGLAGRLHRARGGVRRAARRALGVGRADPRAGAARRSGSP